MRDSSHWVDPCASFSVYNDKGQLIERTKELLNPALSSIDRAGYALGEGYSFPSPLGTALFWGAYWHMHTPLQNIEAGSFVLLELRDGAADNHDNAGCYWARYPVDFATVNSTSDEPLQLSFIANSHSAASRRAMLTTTPSPAASVPAPSTSPGRPSSTSKRPLLAAEARVDCLLHRRDRNVSLDQVVNS